VSCYGISSNNQHRGKRSHCFFVKNALDLGGATLTNWSCLMMKRSAALWFVHLLWPPCVADADIIFLPYGFFLLLLLSFFYSSPNLSGHRLDVYHTSTHGVALVRI